MGYEEDTSKSDKTRIAQGNTAKFGEAESWDTNSELNNTYECLGVIGSGGMGSIFKVRHRILDKIMAIKVIHPHLASATAIRRFQMEGKSTASLSHPCIIAVHNCDITRNGQPYIVMDFVEGETLGDRLSREGSLPIAEVQSIFIKVCTGLIHAHERMVIHRDIKPSNIMLIESGLGDQKVCILDFGIAKLLDDTALDAAKLTQTGDALGSPIYMSPEQAYGRNVDQRADIYSLGCAMYESLTGAPPFAGKTVYETMLMHSNSEAASLSEASLGKTFPANLERLIAKCLEKDPDKRYQTVTELLADLRSFADKEHVSPSQISETLSSTQLSRVSKKLWITAGLLLIVAAGGAGVFMFTQKQPVAKVSTPSVTSSFTDDLDNFGGKALDNAAQRVNFNSLISIANSNKPWFLDLSSRQTFGDITPASFKELRTLVPEVIDLDLGATRIDDEGLEYIKNLKLVTLNLTRNQVRDLRALKNMTSLKRLELSDNQISPEGIDLVCNLPRIRVLGLSGTSLTPADLNKIAQMKNLGMVRLAGCLGITENDIVSLLKERPDLAVEWKPDARDNLRRLFPKSLDADLASTSGDPKNALPLWNQVIANIPKGSKYDRMRALCFEGKADVYKKMRDAAGESDCLKQAALQIPANDADSLVRIVRRLGNFINDSQHPKESYALREQLNKVLNDVVGTNKTIKNYRANNEYYLGLDSLRLGEPRVARNFFLSASEGFNNDGRADMVTSTADYVNDGKVANSPARDIGRCHIMLGHACLEQYLTRNEPNSNLNKAAEEHYSEVLKYMPPDVFRSEAGRTYSLNPGVAKLQREFVERISGGNLKLNPNQL